MDRFLEDIVLVILLPLLLEGLADLALGVSGKSTSRYLVGEIEDLRRFDLMSKLRLLRDEVRFIIVTLQFPWAQIAKNCFSRFVCTKVLGLHPRSSLKNCNIFA